MNDGQRIAEAMYASFLVVGTIAILFFTPVGSWLWALLRYAITAIGNIELPISAARPSAPDSARDDGAAHPAAPIAPRTNGAARAHAENGGAGSARTAPQASSGAILSVEIVGMIRLIAAHKIGVPSDTKTATAKALGIARSGTSERYQLYSVAWDLLYPTPAAPPTLPADDERAWRRDDNDALVRVDARGNPVAR